MSAGVWQGASRAPLRWILAIMAAVDAIVLGVVLARADHAASAASAAPAPLRWLLGAPLAAGAAATAVVLALGAFALRARPLTAGAIALAGLSLLSEAHTAMSDSPRRVFFTTGAMLFGWLAGLVYARALGSGGGGGGGAPRGSAEPEEILAEAGAAAALAATYLNAATSKLGDGGVGWLDSATLRGLLVTSTYLDDPGPLSRAVVEHPGVASALAAGALIAQLGSPLYLVHPRLRVLWGTLLLGFHLNVLLLSGIFYGQATILIAAWSYPWHRLLRRRAPAAGEAEAGAEGAPLAGAGPGERRRLRVVSAGAAVLALGMVITAWAVPVPRLLTWHQPAGGDKGPAAPRDVPLDRLGPLATGDALGGGYRLAGIARAPDHIALRLAPAGAEREERAWVTLRLMPSPSGADRGPFNAGTADLLFDRSAEAQREALLPAGREIARKLREAAGGEDTGRVVAGWLADLPGP